MQIEKVKKFNIRVYGIAIHRNVEVLITDEFRMGIQMCKFPGGGLELGEGTIDCLKREFREELGCEIRILRHFYTTDFFQATHLLDEPQQLISIYYLIEIPNSENLKTTKKKFDFEAMDGAQSFRWVEIKKLPEEELNFPIDKKVLALLKENMI